MRVRIWLRSTLSAAMLKAPQLERSDGMSTSFSHLPWRVAEEVVLRAHFENVKLPVISDVAHQLIQTLDDENASARVISAIISRDPALTAKLMRLANSARFGSSRNVSSVDDAIALAGMAHVRTLALAACFAESFPEMPGLDSDEFWKSSMASAGYAKWLASGLGIDGQDAWLAGMMMRLGELLIYQVAPDALAEIEQQPHLPGGRWERELRLLGFSEGQITAELGRRWNFPPQIVRALEYASRWPIVQPARAHLLGRPDHRGAGPALELPAADRPRAGIRVGSDAIRTSVQPARRHPAPGGPAGGYAERRTGHHRRAAGRSDAFAAARRRLAEGALPVARVVFGCGLKLPGRCPGLNTDYRHPVS
jgi:HD-like signal output (HDOD) protein